MMRGMKSDASIVAPLGGRPILPGRSVSSYTTRTNFRLISQSSGAGT